MRALLVGRGRMGRFHERVLNDLGYEVDAVDPNPGTQAKFEVISEAVLAGRFYTRPEYDVACIACPPEHLVESAFQLAGIPMLVEKPFATNERSAAMLAYYLEAKGAPVAVGFVERFNPRLQELKQQLAGINPTTSRFIRWSDRPCADLALDLLVHDVDLVRYLGLLLPSAQFDTRADMRQKLRRIEVDGGEGEPMLWANLLDHGQTPEEAAWTPLHALWDAFRSGLTEVPRPIDAIAALQFATAYTTKQEVADVRRS